MFSSTLQILTVESEERTSKRTGDKYNHFAARCIVLDDNGQPVTVGVIRSALITPELRANVAPGMYRATFSMQVPDYGPSKGDIVAVVTALVPVPQRTPVRPVEASK